MCPFPAEPLRLIPEFEPQRAVLLSWPHPETDWAPILTETERCYRQIAIEILKRQDLIIVGPTAREACAQIPQELRSRCTAVTLPTNDTWIRDYGPLSLQGTRSGTRYAADYTFNGWGMKFPASQDNQVVRRLQSYLQENGYAYLNRLEYVLEGGSVETDGTTLLSTATCLYEPNRNPGRTKEAIEQELHALSGCRTVVLNPGQLPGDDTDGHIDTLARFIAPGVVAYVAPTDPRSPSYEVLQRLESELRLYPFQLVPLPDTGAVYSPYNGQLLPTSYANFLFINGALLLPVYGVPTDARATRILRNALPDREIVPINCAILTEQHGSLHCATMQLH